MEEYTGIFSNIDAGRVLDVATGNGYFLDLFLKDVRSYIEAVGVDKKEAASTPFGETFKTNSRVCFALMDGNQLDFPDDSFDSVCISHSLHHIEDPLAVLREMKRVLRPGGWFIINEMYADGSQTETQQTHVLLHHWMGKIDTASGVYHRETYSREELLGFTKVVGLCEVQTFDIADLRDDPKAQHVFNELNPVIDRYESRAKVLPDLREFAATLRQRLKEIGFHSASVLIIKAKKQ